MRASLAKPKAALPEVDAAVDVAAVVGAAGTECSPRDEESPPRFTCDFEETPDGEYIWNASRVLLRYLQAPPRAGQFRGRRVLELGSGLGHLGHGLARLGAHVTCTDRGKAIPPLEASLLDQSRLIGDPSAEGGSLKVCELSWGEDGLRDSPEMAGLQEEFDYIISAELVYLEETHDLLLWTLDRFCGPQTVIYSIFINRPFSWNFFAKMHDLDVFEVEQIDEGRDFDACGLEECHMHRLTRRVTEDTA